MGKQELAELIQKKLDKFQLDAEGKAKFDELRKDFPKMPEFLINRAICKNKDADIEKLKKKLEKVREGVKGCKGKFMKGLFEKLGCMKKKMENMKKSKSQYEGFEPQAYGPMYGFAPIGYGPHAHGPHAHGPHAHGPHAHGPHVHGPHGHGPHRHHWAHKYDTDSSSEDKKMHKLMKGFKKMHVTDSSDDSSLEKRSCEKFSALKEVYPNIPEKRIKKVIENHPNKDADGLVQMVGEKIAKAFGKK